jgi:alpha-mannosidase
LHDVEFLSAIADRIGLLSYPRQELNRLWRLLLVIQFHDIIPGTSIAPVYDDVARDFAEIEETGRRLRNTAALALAGKPIAVTSASGSKQAKNPKNAPAQNKHYVPINTTSFQRREVDETPDGKLAIVEAPAYGFGQIIDADGTSAPPGSSQSSSGRGTPCVPAGSESEENKSRRDARAPRGGGLASSESAVLLTESKNAIILENIYLRAEFSKTGKLTSLLEKESKRESLTGPANRLQIYHDHPVKYDAWELDAYHLETVKDCPPAHAHKVSSQPLRAEILFDYKIGNASTMTQAVRLDTDSRRLEFHCTVDWHEIHKVLKVMFPINVHAMNATYEMQFGCVERPTHYNTSYDLARFEVPGHKWADLSEHGFGVALLSDCKYGFSTYGNEMRLTLLRAAKEPDPNTDMGQHQFAYALMPHAASWQNAGVVAEACHFNMPLVWTEVAEQDPDPPKSLSSFAFLDDSNLVLDTIKKAEDSDDLILRLYECHGSHGTAKLAFALPFKSVHFSNILEDEGHPVIHSNGIIEIAYTPYQIITLKLS